MHKLIRAILGLCFFRKVAAFVSTCPPTRTVSSSLLQMTSFQVLGLHGSEGTGTGFATVLENWNAKMNMVGLEVTTIEAPYTKGRGKVWWTMPPGVRSFTADEYDGYEQSKALVLQALENKPDVVVGHSQGAILLTALLAQQCIPSHPLYILNGVAWPNPYTAELESLQLDSTFRILMLCGESDDMNPPEQAHRVQEALKKAGADVSIIQHPKGHAVPQNEDIVGDIEGWILENAARTQDTTVRNK